MAGIKRLPETDVLVKLVGQGMGRNEIARKYGVTGPAVAHALTGAGVDFGSVATRRYTPWKPRAIHQRSILGKRVRDYQRMRAGMPHLENTFALAEFIDMCMRDNRVVDYDPDKGYMLVQREDNDVSCIRGVE